MSSTNVEIPEGLDPTLVTKQIESFAESYAKAMSNSLDTCSMQDLQDGKYKGQIIDCKMINTTDKEGNVLLPRLATQFRCPEFTTTIFTNLQVSGFIFRFFVSMLGDLSKFPAPGDPASMGIREQVDYISSLAPKVIGMNARLAVSHKDVEGKGSYVNAAITKVL